MTKKRTVDAREFRVRDQFLLPWSPARAISVTRAAEMLGCSQDTILCMIDEGEIEAYKLRPDRKNSPYRVYRDSIDRHLEKIRAKYDLPSRNPSA